MFMSGPRFLIVAVSMSFIFGACAGVRDQQTAAASPTSASSARPSSPARTASPPAPTLSPATSSPTASPAESPIHNPAAYREGEPYAVTIDPGDFVATVDHPFRPWTPGTQLVYRGGDERVVVSVASKRKTILGVVTTVVHDQVFTDGELTEDTWDWYAQDRAGNVWYFGEATQELEGGTVTTTAGSWEAGVKGAQAGIVMLADPRIGDTYRQEFFQGEAEDVAKVIQLSGSVTVPAGTYDDLVITEDWTPLDPSKVEHKTYARGIGVVFEELVKGGRERLELVEIRSP
jgi:hypothetical protein